MTDVPSSPGAGPGGDAAGGEPAGAATCIAGVLLDVDDTLVDTRLAFREALHALAAVHLPHLDPGMLPRVVARWRADHGGHYRAYTRGEITHRAQRMARANELQSVFGGAPLDDDGFERWDALFEEAFQGAWTAFDDVAGLLDGLEARGLPVGALTNAAGAYQARKLERVGLAARVPLLVTMDTFGTGKPDPRVFLEACRRLGTDPHATVYVGDELDVDAVAACAAGLRGVWLDRFAHDPAARRVPVSAAELRSAGGAGVTTVAALTEVLGHIDRVGAVPGDLADAVPTDRRGGGPGRGQARSARQASAR